MIAASSGQISKVALVSQKSKPVVDGNGVVMSVEAMYEGLNGRLVQVP